jgi:iron complex outermembrane receptor protein
MGSGCMRRHRAAGAVLATVCASCIVAARAHAAVPSIADINSLTIEQLGDIQVTSVAKVAEPLREAAASVFVITHDDIVRSGAGSIPEMLRIAPNLQVQQESASKYIITARGFSGQDGQQSFTNKLLVLIDGRSVYTPLYSGVYWDMQDVPREDIDRIEVISGPGATLWGANAVNGVINIITRKASETPGGMAFVGGGNLQRRAILQYGGLLSDTVSYRIYAKSTYGAQTLTAAHDGARDDWTRPQTGFRLDWARSSADLVTVQGDAYQGTEHTAGAPNEDIVGANLSARWSHVWQDGSALQVQAYYDRTGRKTQQGGGSFVLNTFDFDLQHSFNLGARNAVVWGGGLRVTREQINGTASLLFVPPNRTLNLSNLFVQDTLTLSPKAKLVIGVKLENEPYAGLQVLPNVRLSITPSDKVMLWVSAAKAVRSPTPFDRDVQEKSGAAVLLSGSSDFLPEKLVAYEAGGRVRVSADASFSVSTYYNLYDDLKSIEADPVTHFFPLKWGNGMKGYTYGVEAWGDVSVTPWWRISPGVAATSQHLTFDQGSSGLLGVAWAGNDPQVQGSIRSAVDIGHRVSWDLDLRYVGVLPNPHLPAYAEMSTSIGWNATERLHLALSGYNLLHATHRELPGGNLIPRSVFVEARLRF